MTRSTAPLLVLVAALFFGCDGDATRIAGGTGSDLPRPTARLLDTSLNLVNAKVWRLWWVYGDSARSVRQIEDSTGFLLPWLGQWIVEGWKDLPSAGALDTSRRVKIAGNLADCESNLTRINGMGDSVVGVIACPEIAAPSTGIRSKILSWGYFGHKDSFHEFIKMPKDTAEDAWFFAVWKVDTSSIRHRPVVAAQTKVEMLVHNPSERYAPYRGVMDIATGSGIWLFQAWNGNRPSKLSGDSMWVDSANLARCIHQPGFCRAQIGDSIPAASYVKIQP